MPPNPGDAELVDIRLPEGVDVTPLETLEGDGLADDPDHEPVPLEDPVNGPPAQPNPSTAKDGVDPHRAPRGVAAPQLEDAIDEVPVDPIRTMAGASRLVPEAFDAFLSVLSTPTT